MNWRFYPLAEHLNAGVLVRDGKEARVAHFLTPAEAKQRQARRLTDQRKADAA